MGRAQLSKLLSSIISDTPLPILSPAPVDSTRLNSQLNPVNETKMSPASRTRAPLKSPSTCALSPCSENDLDPSQKEKKRTKDRYSRRQTRAEDLFRLTSFKSMGCLMSRRRVHGDGLTATRQPCLGSNGSDDHDVASITEQPVTVV